MNIYVYSDESGVFDKVHNRYFVFGGIILLGTEEKEVCSRKYSAAEKTIRSIEGLSSQVEIKASNILNDSKGKLFRSLNQFQKFAVIVNENKVLSQIYKSKKDKQRYLDYVYKIGVKRAFEKYIREGIIIPSEVKKIYFYIDEHTTATNGRYELQESLESEFRRGTYNLKFDSYFPPIFPYVNDVQVEFCNSKNKLLVRAGDIIANKAYYLVNSNQREKLNSLTNMTVTYLP